MLFCLPLSFGRNAELESKALSYFPPPGPPAYKPTLQRPPGAGTWAVLSSLRALMRDAKLDAYIIPNEDAHGSEIPATSELRRGFMTGFHGSAGLAVVTQSEAFLFVDSRYWIAAEKAMDSRIWTLRKVDPRAMVPGGFQDYLCSLPAGSRIGVDARLIPPALKVSLDGTLPTDSRLIGQFDNLVDKVWLDKPPRSTDPVTVHPLKFTGRASDSKITELRETMSTYGSNVSYLVTPLDDLAWLLNLRGNDTFNQPFFYAYLFVGLTDAVLFINAAKVTKEVSSYLASLRIQVQDYESIWEFLREQTVKDEKSPVLIDPKASYAVVQVLGEKAKIIPSPINAAKAIKNETEIQGFYSGNLRDSVAMVRWYGWLEEEIVKKGARVTEYEAQVKLGEYRKLEKYWGGDCSFISAYGPSAALPHYEAEEDDCLVIGRDAPYLIDSGQQYFDCTIDTTRTVHFGSPTAEHKRAFTRVLQAHIAVDALIFPAGTYGTALDGIVRHHLWKDGMNFGHGPGHGIGSFGVVHESEETSRALGLLLTRTTGSTGISVPFELKAGHVVTNEPGFYDEGKFGCRIESTIVCVKKKTLRGFGGDDNWLGFDRCTRVPIQTKLVDFSLLSHEEKVWLQHHNEACYKALKPLLKHDKRAKALLGKFF